MYPPVWGPHMWAIIHLMAYVYPDQPSNERKESMKEFLLHTCNNLPCPACGFHCSVYMKEHPPSIESKENLKKWAYDFHNAVNKRTGKRELTYEEAEQVLIDKFFNRNDWMELKRAQDIRREDHLAINKWKEIAQGINPTPHAAEPCDRTAIIVISIISLLLLLAIIVIFILKSKNNIKINNLI